MTEENRQKRGIARASTEYKWKIYNNKQKRNYNRKKTTDKQHLFWKLVIRKQKWLNLFYCKKNHIRKKGDSEISENENRAVATLCCRRLISIAWKVNSGQQTMLKRHVRNVSQCSLAHFNSLSLAHVQMLTHY